MAAGSRTTPGPRINSFYGGKPIPSTERDATYVVDEILDNETELPIDQHTTDTAGYSELIFSRQFYSGGWGGGAQQPRALV